MGTFCLLLCAMEGGQDGGMAGRLVGVSEVGFGLRAATESRHMLRQILVQMHEYGQSAQLPETPSGEWNRPWAYHI
jgi:hypothetical protein